MDALGNIAMASVPYSIVQDVASAARLFLGELYYGPSDQGVPYFTDALGQAIPTPLLRQALIDAALSVPLVTAAEVFLSAITNRGITGEIQIQTTVGPATVTL